MRAHRLSNEEVRHIREAAAAGVSVSDIAEEYGTHPNSVYMLLRGDSYREAGGPVREARRRYRSDLDSDTFIKIGRQLILDNVEVNAEGCWLWTGTSHTTRGYYNVKLGARSYLVHRLSFLVFNGEVASGFDVGHICHDQSNCEAGNDCQHRRCCCPDHLRAMTHEQNIRAGRGDWRKRLTHCIRGHAFSEANTIVRQKRGGGWQRSCRACARERAQRAQMMRSERSLSQHVAHGADAHGP